MSNVYQFVAVLHPSEREIEDGVKPRILVDVQTVVAQDEKKAALLAARSIEGDVDLDNVELIVRPF